MVLFAALPDLMADANVNATATGRALFRGAEDVAPATIADGEHDQRGDQG